MPNWIKVDVSKRKLTLVPDSSWCFQPTDNLDVNNQDKREFEVVVVNASNKFASFQIDLGVDESSLTNKIKGYATELDDKWYVVEPAICAKKPPGDRTVFRVVVTKSPIPTYKTTIPITIKVFSVEFDTLSTTQTIALQIEEPKERLKIELPQKYFSVYPGDRINVPVSIYNSSPETIKAAVRLTGLDQRWFKKSAEQKWFEKDNERGIEKLFEIPPRSVQEEVFYCRPSNDKNSLPESKVYRFDIQVKEGQNYKTSGFGEIKVLPYGRILFECKEVEHITPSSRQETKGKLYQAKFNFEFINESNLPNNLLATRIQLEIREISQNQQEATTNSSSSKPKLLYLSEELRAQERLPKEIDLIIPYKITKHRHRFLRQTYLFEAKLNLLDIEESSTNAIYPDPSTQIIKIQVLPRFPLWLLLGLGGILLFLVWLLSLLPYSGVGHKAPVTSVRLNGLGNTVFSGSDDRTLRRWDIDSSNGIFDRHRLSQETIMGDESESEIDKAIRVIRVNPFQNEQVVIGLENGDIQLWQVSPPQRIGVAPGGGDRIFDLDFTQDGKQLFGGYGSGLVRQWNVSQSSIPLNKSRSLPRQEAIYALAVINSLSDDQSPILAVAGQYNQIYFWNWQRNILYQANYTYEPSGIEFSIPPITGRYDYINSLAVDRNYSRLVSADNRGFVTVWDLDEVRQCISNTQISREGASELNCKTEEIIQGQWTDPQGGGSIRSVALSDNACYLATAGDDGRILLWFLKQNGNNSSNEPEQLAHFPEQPLRTVDIHQPDDDHVLVVFGFNDQVRVRRHTLTQDQKCESPD
ncbi:MAG: hypothetical protein NW224_12355 [Leptolyngbyaceae cyanobacterium bins.302]|nr:hypothetical protein [Leptolyngbyaceae cyanobacterium bins.302]